MGYPPFAMPELAVAPATKRADPMPSIQDFLDDLPSIDDFVDYQTTALPSIGDFLADDTEEEEWRPQDVVPQTAELDSDGWAVAGWQSFDWGGAASLGMRSQDRSAEADSWDTQDWSVSPFPKASTPGAMRRSPADLPPSAAEVAQALDGIARKIRSGELSIDELSGTPPEAAMAAAIAALLRMRD